MRLEEKGGKKNCLFKVTGLGFRIGVLLLTDKTGGQHKTTKSTPYTTKKDWEGKGGLGMVDGLWEKRQRSRKRVEKKDRFFGTDSRGSNKLWKETGYYR